MERLFARSPGAPGALCQGPFAVIETLANFGDGVHAGLAVLVFDIGGDGILLVFEKLQDGLDGRLAFAERQVGAVVLLTILDVQHRIRFVPANIKIRPDG